jgi:hypothetical protein
VQPPDPPSDLPARPLTPVVHHYRGLRGQRPRAAASEKQNRYSAISFTSRRRPWVCDCLLQSKFRRIPARPAARPGAEAGLQSDGRLACGGPNEHSSSAAGSITAQTRKVDLAVLVPFDYPAGSRSADPCRPGHLWLATTMPEEPAGGRPNLTRRPRTESACSQQDLVRGNARPIVQHTISTSAYDRLPHRSPEPLRPCCGRSPQAPASGRSTPSGRGLVTVPQHRCRGRASTNR